MREITRVLELRLTSGISLYPVSSPWPSAGVELPEPVTISQIAEDPKPVSTREGGLQSLTCSSGTRTADSCWWNQVRFGGSRLILETFRIFALPFAYLNWACTETISRDNLYVLLLFLPPYGWVHHPLTFSRGQKCLGDALKAGVWLLQTILLWLVSFWSLAGRLEHAGTCGLETSEIWDANRKQTAAFLFGWTWNRWL